MTAVGVLALLAGPARGHDEAGELARRPFVRDGELVGAFTSNGLSLRDPDGVFRRVCTEALPPVSDAWLAPDDTFLLATYAGLVRASGAGCEVVADPRWTRAVDRILPVGDALYALVEPSDGPTLLRSDDGGATFAELPPLPEGRWYVQGVAADGAGRLVVAGLVGSGFRVVAWDGATYAPLGVPPDPDPFFLDVLGPAPVGPGVVAVTSGGGAAHLWTSSEVGWAPLVDLPAAPLSRGFGCTSGVCLAATGSSLHRWEVAAGAASLTEVEGPDQCLVAADGALWGCAERRAPALVEVSRDGSTFAPALAPDATLERGCAEAICVAPADTGSPGAPAPDTGDRPAGAGPPIAPMRACGCAAGHPGAGWSWALLALVTSRAASSRARSARPDPRRPTGRG